MCTGGLAGYLSDLLNLADTCNDIIFPWPFSITSIEIFQRWTGVASGLETTPSNIFNGAPRSYTRSFHDGMADS